MYQIKSVEVNGFWGRSSAFISFNKEVNILVGKNGSGKTTFMDILRAVLSVDPVSLDERDFESVRVDLESCEMPSQSIFVKKILDVESLYPFVEYEISGHLFPLRLARPDYARSVSSMRRFEAEASLIKDSLAKLISVTALSVHRLESDENIEISDRRRKNFVSPIDFRLAELSEQISRYHIEISDKREKISSDLQREVMLSLLVPSDGGAPTFRDLRNFQKNEEKNKIIRAYSQLGILDSRVRKLIDEHVDAIDKQITALKDALKKDKVDESLFENFVPFEGLSTIYRFVDLGVEAEEKNKDVSRPLSRFIKTLSSFFEGKDVYFESGELRFSNGSGDQFGVSKLSSGEKQIVIFLVEALLQKEAASVYIVDEPELSLHIEWQRKIIPAIRELNPNTQVIVATHSPEVAGKYRDYITNMEAVLHG